MTFRATMMGLGPHAYWRLGEAAGSTVLADETGNHPAANGTGVLGAAGGLTGDTDTGITMSGSSANRITLPDPISVSSAAWSLVALVKMSTSPPTTYHCSILYMTVDGVQRVGVYARRNATNNRLAMWDNSNLWVESTATLPLGSWALVGVTVSGTAVKFYVDGTPVTTATLGTAPGDLYVTGSLGATAVGDAMKGTLDEVALFDKTLTDQDMADLQSERTNPTTGGQDYTRTVPDSAGLVDTAIPEKVTAGAYNILVRNAANTGWTGSKILTRAIGGAAPTHVGGDAYASATATNHTGPAYPGGVQAGDRGFLAIGHNSAVPIVTPPAGWTYYGSQLQIAANLYVDQYTRTMDGTETGGIGFSLSGGSKADAGLDIWRDTTGILKVAQDSQASTTGTTQAAAVASGLSGPAVETGIFFEYSSTPSTTVTFPAELTSVDQAWATGSGSRSAAVGYRSTVDADGSVGSGTWTRDSVAASVLLSLTVAWGAQVADAWV